MVLAYVDWVGTLSAALGLACVTQLIVGGVLAYTVSDFLTFTGSLHATGATLVAGFVTLPTTMQLRSSQMTPNMDRVYGYTLCYSKLAIGVSLATHLAGTLLSVVGILNAAHIGNEFLQVMKKYDTEQSSKSMVDNIQWALQCCGSKNYNDWFMFDWEGHRSHTKQKYRKKSISELLLEDAYPHPDLSTGRNDAVPFSCCIRKIQAACVHEHIFNTGTSTINTFGCGRKLKNTVQSLLAFELCLNGICVPLEVIILMLLGANKSGEVYEDSRTLKEGYARSLDRFTNESDSVAEITPSFHHEITIKRS